MLKFKASSEQLVLAAAFEGTLSVAPELDGKAPLIVFANAPLAEAATSIVKTPLECPVGLHCGKRTLIETLFPPRNRRGTCEEILLPDPGTGELRVRHTAVGVNFHDIYVRSDLYRTLPPPGIPGIEASSLVEAIGQGVSGFSEGDRICYATGGYGAYAAVRNLPPPLPSSFQPA